MSASTINFAVLLLTLVLSGIGADVMEIRRRLDPSFKGRHTTRAIILVAVAAALTALVEILNRISP